MQGSINDSLRTCNRCGERTVRTSRGTPICDNCRIVPSTGKRKRQFKRCPECGEGHETSSGNEVCGRCRQAKMRHPCPDCGAPTDHRAERCRRCARNLQVLDHAPSWKGGRRHTVRGYVMVTAPAGHPRAYAPGKRGYGYIREHVLVMEERLGRYLLPGETVHHCNGVKDDNRPENLELWTSSHPAGQRVTDLVAWAHEVIALYDA